MTVRTEPSATAAVPPRRTGLSFGLVFLQLVIGAVGTVVASLRMLAVPACTNDHPCNVPVRELGLYTVPVAIIFFAVVSLVAIVVGGIIGRPVWKICLGGLIGVLTAILVSQVLISASFRP